MLRPASAPSLKRSSTETGSTSPGPADPKTGEIVSKNPADQTARTLENNDANLEAAGSSLDEAMRVTVYLTDMDDYDDVNEVHETFLSEPYPARTAVEVSRLPIDIAVEMNVIASCRSSR